MHRAAAFLAAFLCLVLSKIAFARTSSVGEPQRLAVPGAPDAFFYKPQARGKKAVLMFLHGRGGNPAEDCRKWARVGTQFGWVVCPQGPEDRGEGSRSWQNSVPSGKSIIDKTLDALATKFRGRVQRRGNILIGFSEGAFIAMQVGVRDSEKWNRWLILAANDQYWYGDAPTVLREHRKRIKRVYLLTGEGDEVAANTERVGTIVKDTKIPVKTRIVPGMGHEVPADRMISLYRRPLLWLSSAK